jgi:hypothetical protein
MAAVERISQGLGVNIYRLSREENLIVEMELIVRVCDELRDSYRARHIDYFRLMKFDMEQVNTMVEENFIVDIIKDLLISQEYSLEGIAEYTQTPVEVICDIAAGYNHAPSLQLSRKLITLHRLARPNLYREIMKKVVADYLVQV